MLLDTNIIIYAGGRHSAVIQAFITAYPPAVSVISYIEALGYHGLTPSDEADLREFFGAAIVVPLTDEVAQQAVRLRQQRRIKLGDSIIAATALVYGRTLATRNTADFRDVPGLRLHDPLAGVA